MHERTKPVPIIAALWGSHGEITNHYYLLKYKWETQVTFQETAPVLGYNFKINGNEQGVRLLSVLNRLAVIKDPHAAKWD